MNKVIVFCLAVVLLVATSAIAADKVVVIPLNSTKINKQQTLVYSRFALQITGGVDEYIGFVNGCSLNAKSGAFGTIPLILPLGSKILSVIVGVYDGNSSNTYTVRLERTERTVDHSALTGPTLSTVTGGTLPKFSGTIVEVDLTPGFIEVVENTESFHLEFTTPVAFSNGFCYARMTIELP